MPSPRPTAAPIVFGTTLAPDAVRFADVAATLAQRLRCPLTLVHASEAPRGAALEAEAQRLRERTGAEVRTHLAPGPVPSVLASRAQFELARALLLGPGGRTLTEQLSRLTQVPVLCLRQPEALEAWLGGGRPLRALVGADFGRAAAAARAFVTSLREAGPVTVEVLHLAVPAEVHERLHLRPPRSPFELDPEARTALTHALARTSPPGEQDATLHVAAAEDAVAAQLCQRAQEGAFDLLVVGRRPRSWLEALWSGSVSRAVLRDARVNAACVPPEAGPPPAPWRAPKTVLVATDFSPASQRALSAAAGLVADGGTVHLAHALPVVLASLADAREARASAWAALTRTTFEPAREAQVQHHVLEGEPASQLLALAERVGAELLVAGIRGHQPLPPFHLGSVAQALSARAHVPLLLVPLAGP